MEGIYLFKEKLENQYDINLKNKVLENLKETRFTTFRVNTIKAKTEDVVASLNELGFNLEQVDFYNCAFILLNKSQEELESTYIYKEGKIYLQSLSSMLPPIVLDAKENMDILDMAAAPGGKTTELACLTNNKARITACELNKIRAERLKYNVKNQQATSVLVLEKDARKLDDFFSFDSILLDAPCSGSGTRVNENDFNGFSTLLINKSVKSQKELLRRAIKHLKKNQTMVYSTCSIFKEENEDIVRPYILSGELEAIKIDINSSYLELLPSTIENALTIMPNKYYEGFFVIKLRKRK